MKTALYSFLILYWSILLIRLITDKSYKPDKWTAGTAYLFVIFYFLSELL